MTLRTRVGMLVAEFLGTATLASVILPLIQFRMFPWFSAVAAGTTVGVMVLLVGQLSGAHLNPAITLGQWTIRKVPTLQAALMILSQFVGGLVAWRLNEYFTGNALSNIANKSFDWKVFVAELLGTFLFSFGVTAAVTQKLEGYTRALAIGGSLTIGVLVASIASNALLNPAVAVGVQSWSLVYAVGPLAGAILGSNIYQMLMAPEASFRETYGSVSRPARVERSARTPVASATARRRPATKRGRKPVRRTGRR